jgi:hypothetical protein
MANGGARPGAGRPKGSKSSFKTEAVRRAIEAAVLSDELSPVDVMLRVMRGDETITPKQYAAAVDVAPYVCPRLSAVAVQPVSPDAQLTNQQIDRRLAELTARMPPLITIGDGLGNGGADSSQSAQQSQGAADAPPRSPLRRDRELYPC